MSCAWRAAHATVGTPISATTHRDLSNPNAAKMAVKPANAKGVSSWEVAMAAAATAPSTQSARPGRLPFSTRTQSATNARAMT